MVQINPRVIEMAATLEDAFYREFFLDAIMELAVKVKMQDEVVEGFETKLRGWKKKIREEATNASLIVSVDHIMVAAAVKMTERTLNAKLDDMRKYFEEEEDDDTQF